LNQTAARQTARRPGSPGRIGALLSVFAVGTGIVPQVALATAATIDGLLNLPWYSHGTPQHCRRSLLQGACRDTRAQPRWICVRRTAQLETMANILIVWHSRTGAARAMAEAAAAGAADEPEAQVSLLAAEAAGPDDLIAADGLIFAAPENLASLSGEMKAFLDRSYYPALGRLEGRPYAVMIAAGSDGTAAARQLARIATGWRLKPIAEPLIVCTHAQTPEAILAEKRLSAETLAPCRELGAAMAAGLALGVF
jgi:NAD(P)H-dependent FMN reductase